ncbi:MAG: prefoldin subunit alpha [Candidatus Methanoperedens sp.]|nr:prefoldin subunit alpha [Candidatus Methanoperedens sp.]MCE8428147.1 prefoldin subunit alpha [Candidatus Methanoperedens sp.]
MNDKKITQQQLQELAVRHEQYQYQAESMAQQINLVQMTIKEVEMALTTIDALKETPAGKETLVPIGFGSFVKATLTNPDKVVIGIGAGISIEKKIDDAKTLLDKRKDELTKYNEQLNTTISKIALEIQNIEKIAQRFEPSQQQTNQPMHAE